MLRLKTRRKKIINLKNFYDIFYVFIKIKTVVLLVINIVSFRFKERKIFPPNKINWKYKFLMITPKMYV